MEIEETFRRLFLKRFFSDCETFFQTVKRFSDCETFFTDCETFFPTVKRFFRLKRFFFPCETFFRLWNVFFPTRENGFEAATLQGVLCVLHFVMTRTDTPFWMHGFQNIICGYLCSHTFRFPMVTGYDLKQKGIIWNYSQVTSFEVPAVGREYCVPLRKHWLSERYSLGLCGA